MCKKSQQDSRVAPSRSAVTPLNETVPHGHGWLELCTLSSAQPLVVKLRCAAHANTVVFSVDFVHFLTVFYPFSYRERI